VVSDDVGYRCGEVVDQARGDPEHLLEVGAVGVSECGGFAAGSGEFGDRAQYPGFRATTRRLRRWK
jgi:hypothetical protein